MRRIVFSIVLSWQRPRALLVSDLRNRDGISTRGLTAGVFTQGRPNDDERFAANFMMHMLVQDIDAWWSRIATLDLAKRYGVKAPTAPELQPWGSRRRSGLGSVRCALAYREKADRL
jgi:hypothetical protein